MEQTMAEHRSAQRGASRPRGIGSGVCHMGYPQSACCWLEGVVGDADPGRIVFKDELDVAAWLTRDLETDQRVADCLGLTWLGVGAKQVALNSRWPTTSEL